ncbi:hypothetical protein BDD12DRAFT_983181 [Trichophaea hybrida]|nr:hypothetical protein BDD12DRAFT_983181 [Trichophaea hybrida]
MAAVVVSAVAGLGSYAAGSALSLVGFGPMGPVAGSLAATWQATTGGVIVASSWFATFQSLGMTLGAVTFPVGAVAVGAGSLAVGAVAVGAGGLTVGAVAVGAKSLAVAGVALVL